LSQVSAEIALMREMLKSGRLPYALLVY